MPAPFTLSDMSGVMWPEHKRKDNYPDFKGEISIDGKIYGIAVWRKRGKVVGGEFLSCRLTRPEEHAEWKRKEEEYLANRSGIPTAPPPPPLRAAPAPQPSLGFQQGCAAEDIPF